jgi:tetratricopeptide (TPR) repeat protein
MARVDLIPEQAKGLLQKGAAAGREFSHRLIKKVADVAEEELLSYLSVLKDSELRYERGIYPQSNYVFKHALTQEVAYNSLLLTYSFLGMAYLRLGKVESAPRLLEKGHNLCLFSEIPFGHPYAAGSLGFAYLLAYEPRRALTVLEEGTKPSYLESGVWIVHPLTVLADAYRAVGDIALATETVSHALKLADEGEERGFEAWTMLVMAGIYDAAERLEEAKQWYQRALKQASNLSMHPLVAHCHKGLTNSYHRLKNEKEAQLENKMALEIYRSFGMTHWLG